MHLPDDRRSYLSHLYCPRCARTYSADEPHNVCECGSPLLVAYDLDALKREVARDDLASRRASLWRYWELLPVRDARHAVTLGEGFTPILPLARLGAEVGVRELILKDEGLNPTGSFKARGAAVGVSRAKELGIREVAMPTAGNAGGAWAAYCARAGISIHVAMPSDAPEVNKAECRLYGADLSLVDGLISDAGRLIQQGVRERGWFDVSTLREPYRIEGKKTMGFEIAEQLGWELPEVIVYPAGGGVGVIGIWKALDELREIGWVSSGVRPKLVIVQAEGCAPLVKAWDEGRDESEFWSGAQTIAAGLRVPKALGDFLVLRCLRETGGTAVAVSDAEIVQAMRDLARAEGLWVCPEGAATLAGIRRLKREGWLSGQERLLLLNTGSGLKYADLAAE
jgi:threonine synthase